jgi:hypothetical protein
MGLTAGPLNLGRIMNLAAAVAGGVGLTYDNHNHRGAHVGVNVTAITGTLPVLIVYIEGQDEASGQWYVLLQSVDIATVGFNRLSVYPGITPVLNQAVSNVLPATWRVRYSVTGVGAAVTATFGACLLR